MNGTRRVLCIEGKLVQWEAGGSAMEQIPVLQTREAGTSIANIVETAPAVQGTVLRNGH
jgi:hypothetical protein